MSLIDTYFHQWRKLNPYKKCVEYTNYFVLSLDNFLIQFSGNICSSAISCKFSHFCTWASPLVSMIKNTDFNPFSSSLRKINNERLSVKFFHYYYMRKHVFTGRNTQQLMFAFSNMKHWMYKIFLFGYNFVDQHLYVLHSLWLCHHFNHFLASAKYIVNV